MGHDILQRVEYKEYIFLSDWELLIDHQKVSYHIRWVEKTLDLSLSAVKKNVMSYGLQHKTEHVIAIRINVRLKLK